MSLNVSRNGWRVASLVLLTQRSACSLRWVAGVECDKEDVMSTEWENPLVTLPGRLPWGQEGLGSW